MQPVKIAILDSGVRTEHLAFHGKKVRGFSLFVDNDKVIKTDNFDDSIGHGTAVYWLIKKSCDEAEIDNIRIYDEKNEITYDELVKILEYIYSHDTTSHYDFINISMGITRVGCTSALENICCRLKSVGTIVISAFDNEGAVSFPAALDSVVGVDIDRNKDVKGGLTLINNSIVNIAGPINTYRVPWFVPEYILVSGTSFLCAVVTAELAALKGKSGRADITEICSNKIEVENSLKTDCFAITKAAVFPFNKEVQVMARFEDMLLFEVVDYYSVKIAGNVGKEISSLLKNCTNRKRIKDIDNIDWSVFDTLIIGHTDELAGITGRNYKKELLERAAKERKKVYAFDNSEMTAYTDEISTGRFFSQVITGRDVYKRFGKLYKTDKPILSVIGTNSKQGKYSLQLELRKRFMKLGYSLGQIGTEPTAMLFGMDKMFCCGYGSSLNLLPEQVISYVNQMIHEIAQKDVEIIIAGCQAALLGYNADNMHEWPYIHRLFFEGLGSDAMILCINAYDEREYVIRTIKLAEGISGGKVIALVCWPFNKEGMLGFRKGNATLIPDERSAVKNEYPEYRVFFPDVDNDLDELTSWCIDFFSE